MSDLGIRIGVDSREVTEARKELQGLNDNMKFTKDNSDLGFGEGLEGASEALRELSKQVNRLKGMAATGDKQGGILNENQFKQAAKLSKEIGDNFASYRKSLQQAENILDGLVSKRIRLQRITETSPYSADRKAAEEELKTLGPKIEKLKAELSKRDTRGSRLERDFTRDRGALGGMGGGGGGMLGKGWKGMLKGMALIGVGVGIASYVKEGLHANERFAPIESDLTMRGGDGARYRGKTKYGYGATESIRIADMLNRRTGMGGEQLESMGETAKAFSRSHGLGGADTTTEFMAQLYQPTGMNPQQYERYIREVSGAIKTGGFTGRTEEYMRSNQQIIQMISSGRGGAPLTESEVSRTNLLQSKMWGSGLVGQGASGLGMLSTLDQGIRGGGQGANQQMFMMNALGMEGGVGGYWDYMKMKEGGIFGEGDTSNIQKIMEHTVKRFGGAEGGGLSDVGKLNLKGMFPNLTTKQVELLSQQFSQGAFAEGGDAEGAIAEYRKAGDIEAGAAKAAHTLGGEIRETEAKFEKIKLEATKEMTLAAEGAKHALAELGLAAVGVKDIFLTIENDMGNVDPEYNAPDGTFE